MLANTKPYYILVIEDNKGDFNLIREMTLEYSPESKIYNARNFKEAFSYLSEENNKYDVIILDLSLPDKSGDSLIGEIIKLSQHTPIIILTGNSDISFSINAISKGISDYLVKDDLNAVLLYKSILYSIEREKNFIALKESEKRYIDLFMEGPQPSWIYDTETLQIVNVNKAAVEKYGYTEEEFLSITVLQIRSDENINDEFDMQLSMSKEEKSLFRRELQHLKKSGELIDVDIYSRFINVSKKKLILIVAIDVTEKKRNHENVIRAIVKTQEDERFEIGSELHDNVCQILAVSFIYLSKIENQIGEGDKKWIFLCKENLESASIELRNLSHRLAPVFFKDVKLEESFKSLINTFNINKTFNPYLHVDPGFNNIEIPKEIKLNLYRILQEQLKNIIKYAKASIVEIDIKLDKGKIIMQTIDNGIGFDFNLVQSGIGLSNMKRRVELFKGNFSIDTAMGMGCKITIEIPLY